MTKYEQVADIKNQINSDMGIVDILVNNAGLMPRYSFRDGDPRNIQRVMDTNVMAHFWVILLYFCMNASFVISFIFVSYIHDYVHEILDNSSFY